jgi:hypothetical protein
VARWHLHSLKSSQVKSKKSQGTSQQKKKNYTYNPSPHPPRPPAVSPTDKYPPNLVKRKPPIEDKKDKLYIFKEKKNRVLCPATSKNDVSRLKKDLLQNIKPKKKKKEETQPRKKNTTYVPAKKWQ